MIVDFCFGIRGIESVLIFLTSSDLYKLNRNG